MIRMGINPIGWSNDDMPELGGEVSLEQCLNEAKSAGFEGVELGSKFPRNSSELKPILSKHGLDLVSGWYSAGLLERDAEAEMKALRPHLDLLKDFGVETLIFAETSNTIHGSRGIPLSKRPILQEDRWPEFGRRITEVAEQTLSEGLRLAYHHHMGTVVQSEDDIHNLMKYTGDAVHLLLDTGHAAWGGAEPTWLAKRYRDRISHIHTKDVRPDVVERAGLEDMSFLDAVIAGVYTVPGDGSIDFVAFLREFAGYSGWIVVEAEQYQHHTSAAEYARIGAENLGEYLAMAGLTG